MTAGAWDLCHSRQAAERQYLYGQLKDSSCMSRRKGQYGKKLCFGSNLKMYKTISQTLD